MGTEVMAGMDSAEEINNDESNERVLPVESWRKNMMVNEGISNV